MLKQKRKSCTGHYQRHCTLIYQKILRRNFHHCNNPRKTGVKGEKIFPDMAIPVIHCHFFPVFITGKKLIHKWSRNKRTARHRQKSYKSGTCSSCNAVVLENFKKYRRHSTEHLPFFHQFAKKHYRNNDDEQIS